ncbi:MAG TPA: hypothetical protein VMV46_14810 [Thermoanaerobaculia bacterium]|nr:hypothetical protein [Thermoanaerobaculia bacterium]
MSIARVLTLVRHCPRTRRGRGPLAGCLLAALTLPLPPGLASAGAASAEESAAALVLAAVEVAPPDPGDETLCQLRVRVENRGERPASALGFEVRLDGEPLAVYEKQLFYQKLPPGQTSEVRLFNFWTTETGRARPADGVLDVEVVLREAVWLEITEEKEEGSDQPVEVWTPVGEVAGLPVSKTLVLRLK